MSGPPSARQRNAISMAFRCRADGGPTLNAGLVALWFYWGYGPVLLRNRIFCDFTGGVRTPSPPTPCAFAHIIAVNLSVCIVRLSIKQGPTKKNYGRPEQINVTAYDESFFMNRRILKKEIIYNRTK